MTTKHLFTVAFLCLLASAPTFAQDNPFGGGSDPFGGGRKVAPAKSSTAKSSEANAPAASKARAKVADRPSSSDVEERLQASLSEKTTQGFQDTPLEEALHVISQSHGIPIVLDRRALDEIGLARDIPVSLKLQDVPLRVFLRLMLREFDLTYLIKDEVIQITTVEVAEQHMVVKMHAFPKGLVDKSDQIVRALQATVQPDTWKESGGPSTVVPIENVMAVSANAFVHDQVAEFLVKLDAAYEARKAKDK